MASGDLILITGSTGHLGFRTLTLLLQQGYRARITHRRPGDVEKLTKQASIKPFEKSLEFALVPDITKPNAYDEAIKGVDGVIHVASPIYTGFDAGDTDWKKLLYEPAEQGCLNILNAALTEPRVKRVVMTSSVVVLEPKNGAKKAGPYDIRALPDAETMANPGGAAQAYVLSKTVAHISATKFMEQHPGSFDLIRVFPGYIQGANELYSSAKELGELKTSGSNEGIMTVALGRDVGSGRPTSQVFLDDVANAHVLGLKPSVVKNLENLLIAGNGGDSVPWKDFVPVIERLFPDAVKQGLIKPKAFGDEPLYFFDVESSEKALGYKFAGPEPMVQSVVGQYLSLLKSA